MDTTPTFIVDCPFCRAKVGVVEKGRVQRSGIVEEIGEPFGELMQVGSCPRCHTLLGGESQQLDFAGYDADEDRWSDVVRVHPQPKKTFSSDRIPRIVERSLDEADRSLQANASMAACVMFGRALEAVCRDILQPKDQTKTANFIIEDHNTKAEKQKENAKPEKRIMLAAGIKQLRQKNIIDDRLYDWSQQLHAFRNLAAHPDEI